MKGIKLEIGIKEAGSDEKTRRIGISLAGSRDAFLVADILARRGLVPTLGQTLRKGLRELVAQYLNEAHEFLKAGRKGENGSPAKVAPKGQKEAEAGWKI